ncbi:uncharacterized protein [Parasteatoda tepidariorum]|uniref:uncharacterized protein n=1 Tax=Parasteatoda tepidariorum TaxID=114398 RepID=UPI001C71AFD2|nr:uncharacterized protein LOC107453689 isoform X1 [Parasteatoda tepidariorum]
MYGYGNEDLFSPLRAETSFNENPYNSQKDSSMAEFLQGQSSLIIEKNMEDLIMCQKKNSFFENSGPINKVNGTKEQLSFNASKAFEDNRYKAAVQNEFLSALSYDDVTFGNSVEKDFPMEIGTKRCRSSSQSGKEYQEGNYSPKYTNPSNSTPKSKQAKHYYNESLKNYASPRSETHKTKEQFDKLSAKCAKYPSNNLLCCTEKKEVEVIDLESIDICESSSEKSQSVSVNNEKSQHVGNEWDGVNEITIIPKKSTKDFNFEEKSTLLSVPNYYSQQQIQTSIVEKLIKDTVSFEFDAIRQLLYLQYLCLSRHLHQTQDMFGNLNSSSCEFMLKVIEELMQENRLLKKAVVAHQRRT